MRGWPAGVKVATLQANRGHRACNGRSALPDRVKVAAVIVSGSIASLKVAASALVDRHTLGSISGGHKSHRWDGGITGAFSTFASKYLSKYTETK